MKKISVIVNCHNGEKYLSQCILSIINQTYSNLEIIIFDNFSSDKSKNIIDNFNDERIKYYKSSTKLSLYKARNEAIKKVTGEFIAFLDVDDWWSLNKLELQIKLFTDPSVQLVYGNFLVNNFKKKSVIYGIPARKIKPNKKAIMYDFNLPSGYILDYLIKEYVVGMMTIMIRKEIFSDYKYRDKKNSSIVSISSVSSLEGNKGISLYSSSKAASNNLVKCYAKELAIKKIRINSIIIRHTIEGMGKKINKKLNKDQINELLKKHPLGFGGHRDVLNA